MRLHLQGLFGPSFLPSCFVSDSWPLSCGYRRIYKFYRGVFISVLIILNNPLFKFNFADFSWSSGGGAKTFLNSFMSYVWKLSIIMGVIAGLSLSTLSYFPLHPYVVLHTQASSLFFLSAVRFAGYKFSCTYCRGLSFTLFIILIYGSRFLQYVLIRCATGGFIASAKALDARCFILRSGVFSQLL